MSGSAYLGQPTNTEEDYYVARALLLLAGVSNVDAHKGLKGFPHRPPPDQYHFETKAPGIIAGMVVSIVIMVSVTGGRLLTRWLRPSLKAGWDDILIIPGVLLALVWPTMWIVGAARGGAGKHTYDVTYAEYYIFKWAGATDKIVFFVAVGIIKMSITIFNMRITGLTSRNWMIAHWTFFFLLVCYTLAAFFVNVFQCNPPIAEYDLIAVGKLQNPPRCANNNTFGIPLSIIHVAMDFCLLMVPIIVLWKIQMHWSTKIRLYFVFSIGAMSCIGSVMRQIAQGRLASDATYNFTTLLAWTLVDLTCGVVAASLPILSALIPSFKPRTQNYPPSSARYGGRTLAGSNFSNHQPEGAERLHSKDSCEGILRKDEIELDYQPVTHKTLDLEQGNGLRLRPDDVEVQTITYPANAQPRSSKAWNNA